MERQKNLGSSSLNASSLNNNINGNNNRNDDFKKNLEEYYNNNYRNNKSINQQQHFEYSGQPLEQSFKSNNSLNVGNISTFTFATNGKLNSSNQLNQSSFNLGNSNLLNSSVHFDLSNSIAIKKENKLMTKNQYVGFSNNYGDNSCYVNVIMHILFNIPDISNIFKDLHEIDDISKENPKANDGPKNSNQKNQINNSNKSSKQNNITINDLFVEIGQILSDYEMYLNKQNTTQQVTILDTKKMRTCLEKISGGQFHLNYVADPVELLIFILDHLNVHYKREIHSNFFIELIDKAVCLKNCPNLSKNAYDKDNFLYHIYVEELLTYIKDNAIKFENSKGDLFHLSYSLYTDEKKECPKCNLMMDKFLLCLNVPKYLLINCVWRNECPEIKEIVDFLFLLSIEEDLNSLFICQNNNRNSNTIYNFLGMILYSFTLCHYTVLIFDKKQHLFTLYNDDIVKEFKTLYDAFSEMLIDNVNLYDNDKAYFYPVMLIYSKNTIYNTNDINLNMLDEKKYLELLNKIEVNKNNYIKRHTLSEEQKKKNLEDMIEEQKKYEQKMLNKKLTNKDNNIDNNIGSNTNNNINNYNNNKKNENDWMNYNFEDEENKKKNRITNNNNNKNVINDSNSKVYGNDLLYGDANKNKGGMEYYKNYIRQLNNMDISDLVIRGEGPNKGYSQNEFLKNIHEQSNYRINSNNIGDFVIRGEGPGDNYSREFFGNIHRLSNSHVYNDDIGNLAIRAEGTRDSYNRNNLIKSQRINITNDIDDMDEGNRLAQSQVIPDTKYFVNKNKNNNDISSNRINNNNNKRNQGKHDNKLSSSQYINPSNNYRINDSQSGLRGNNKNLAQSQYNIGRNNDVQNLSQSQMSAGRNNNSKLAQSHYNIGRGNRK